MNYMNISFVNKADSAFVRKFLDFDVLRGVRNIEINKYNKIRSFEETPKNSKIQFIKVYLF